MANFARLSGQVYLQADNLNWHLIEVYINTGIDLRTLTVDQTPIASPGSYDAYAIITADNALNYKFSLISGIDIEGSGFVTYDIAQTATGDAGITSLDLVANDGLYYPLNLVYITGQDYSGVQYSIGPQTLSPETGQAHPLVGYITGDPFTYISRMHQLTTGINTLYGFELEGIGYTGLSTFPLYQAQRILAQQANILTAQTSGYYHSQFFTGRKYF